MGHVIRPYFTFLTYFYVFLKIQKRDFLRFLSCFIRFLELWSGFGGRVGIAGLVSGVQGQSPGWNKRVQWCLRLPSTYSARNFTRFSSRRRLIVPNDQTATRRKFVPRRQCGLSDWLFFSYFKQLQLYGERPKSEHKSHKFNIQQSD